MQTPDDDEIIQNIIACCVAIRINELLQLFLHQLYVALCSVAASKLDTFFFFITSVPEFTQLQS